MKLGDILESNKQLYVIAEVKLRENYKAVSFEPLLVAGSYEMALKLYTYCKADDLIIIPPFTEKEDGKISPGAVATFYQSYYKIKRSL